MRLIILLATILVLRAPCVASAQDVTDFLDLQGEKTPLSIDAGKLAIAVRDGTTADRFKAFAQERNYKIAEELPGGLYIVEIAPKQRNELVQLPRDIKRENDDLVAQAGIVATAPGIDYPLIITDEIIVQFEPSVTTSRARELVEEQSASLGKPSAYYPNQFIVEVDGSSKGDALQVSARLQAMTDLVVFAHPNFITVVEPQEMIPNDRLFGDQWHHRNTSQKGGVADADIDTSLAWEIEQGTPGTTIAVIDFGFDMTHPDLQPNFWRNPLEANGSPGVDDDGNGYVDDVNGWDFVDNDNDPSGPDLPAGSRHGTAVAGVAAARGSNAIGVSGSCPGCSLMLVRISQVSSTQAVADAIGYAASNGAAILSNSWAFPAVATLVNALDNAAATGRGGLGSVIFLSMRNNQVDDCGNSRLPSLSSVIAVNRSTNRDLFDAPSSFGSCLDILAPTAWLSTISAGTGTAWITTTDMTGAAGYNNNDILDDCPEQSSSSNDALDYTNCFIGTSSSTPLAAGVSGLLITAAPALTRLQVQNLLQDTADKIEDSAGAYSPGNGYSAPGSGRPTHGRGRINAYEALRVIAPAGLGGHDGVDIFLRDNRLDWGNTEQPSNTRFEAPRGTIAHWESMDIKVDAPPYQMTPTAANFSAFDDETPSAISGETNKVYVRLRNRGPQTPATAGVKLYWTQFGTALPPLPADFWQQFPSDSADASQWHPLDCAVGGTTACAVTNLAYSGASAAEGMGDAAQIVAFDFPAPAVDSTFSNHFCLVAMVDSPQDPISPVSKAAFLVDSITPFDNNVTHRNYLNLPTTAAFRERIVVRNPFDRALETALQVAAPAGWEVSGEPFGIGKPFKLAPLEEVAVTLTVRNAKRKGIVTVWQIDVGSDKATIIGGLTLRFRAGQ